ncbi:MAG: 30S ribosomal protein S3 [Kiritimatiellae bacterium]|nr:30S ribosomal protein S3 [Kiritimatiellia bacterium]NLD90799.1 30S ribosomal protein S3 [Lentisphaerota bacterium]HOU22167.1 30S ribosomal protein S3 [Kiritimatiellia bacterium]HPC20675.1 30S ribosomal protein S3 [Kiritimatiellia bacterium]HQN80563.1 30S ribosomal protein S3 [Kiritimatiellia bacterium]
MGQKVNPIGFRTTVSKEWKSRWFAERKEFGDLLNEDLVIRDLVRARLKDAAVADIVIERYAQRVRVTVYTARPGVVIGRKGEGIDKLREELSAKTGKEVYVEIKEVRNPDANAQLVAENIALQLERRVAFRRAMKRALQLAMDMGALGVRVQACGRLGGAELARTEHYMVGKVPLQTLRADVQYGFAEANTMAGKIGIKCWICQKPEEAKTPGKERTYAPHA